MGISAIIPTYNPDQYLNRAISSVLSQDKQPDEIIVVDDGSNYDVQSILSSDFEESIKFIQTSNKGPGAARNKGVEESSERYVAFLDDDDEWAKHKLSTQLEAIGSANMCLSDSHTICPDGTKTYHSLRLPQEKNRKIAAYLKGDITATIPGMLVSRRAFQLIGGFDEDLPRKEDHLFMMRYLEHFDLVHVEKPLFNRYKRLNGLSNTAGPEEIMKTKKLILEQISTLNVSMKDIEKFKSDMSLQEAIAHFNQGERSKSVRKLVPYIMSQPSKAILLLVANLLPLPAAIINRAKRKIQFTC